MALDEQSHVRYLGYGVNPSSHGDSSDQTYTDSYRMSWEIPLRQPPPYPGHDYNSPSTPSYNLPTPNSYYTPPPPPSYNLPPGMNHEMSGYHMSTGMPRYDSPDEEVAFFSDNQAMNTSYTSFPVDIHERCASTDTSVSASSIATVLSVDSQCSNVTELTSSSQATGGKRKRERKSPITSLETSRKKDTIYRRHGDKPPYTYCGMIIIAIVNSPNRMLSLIDIQSALMGYFPAYFCGSYTGWRDSVRHTLSHLKCFNKETIYVPGLKQKLVRRFVWSVDLSKVDKTMLCRRGDNPPGTSFSYFLHDEIGLPAVQLSGDYATECDVLLNKPTDRQTPDFIDAHQYHSPSESSRYSMHLPHVDPCVVPVESPHVYQRREHLYTTPDTWTGNYEDVSPAKSTNQRTWDHAPSTLVYPPNEHLTPNVCDVMNFIAANHLHHRRSSLSAVDNLSSLCTPLFQHETICTDDSNSFNESEPVVTPVDTSPEPESDCTDDDDESVNLHSSNFTVSKLLRPISPDSDIDQLPASSPYTEIIDTEQD